MPYYHDHCGGEIRMFPPKCKKCNKRWSPLALLAPTVPKGMSAFELPRAPQKGKTSYAKWADKAPPGTAWLASKLPNWPRWARILTALVIVSGILALILVVC